MISLKLQQVDPSSVTSVSDMVLIHESEANSSGCSEPLHVRGDNVRPCLMCSTPVCEACIIKASFEKRDHGTFANRCRSLCAGCYNLGNAQGDGPPFDYSDDNSPSSADPGKPFCSCTARDGHLCLKCMTEQKSDSIHDKDKCHGRGCYRTMPGGFSSKVCLWCGLRLPGEHDRALARRKYDSKHLLARSHSTYERRTEAEILEAQMMEAAMVDSLWALDKTALKPVVPKNPWTVNGFQNELQQTSIDFLARPKHTTTTTSWGARDPAEEERQRVLNEVSVRRSSTAAAAEEARWNRAEALRRERPETNLPGPPLVRRRTEGNAGWRDTDSIAPTLVEEHLEECSDDLGKNSNHDNFF